eukprot:3938327-Rhodomonas_salina.3
MGDGTDERAHAVAGNVGPVAFPRAAIHYRTVLTVHLVVIEGAPSPRQPRSPLIGVDKVPRTFRNAVRKPVVGHWRRERAGWGSAFLEPRPGVARIAEERVLSRAADDGNV